MPTYISETSRLRFSDFVKSDSIEFWDLSDIPEIPILQDESSYQVVSTDRIDSLAYRFYGDSNLWWVLASANNIDLLPSGLFSGQILRVPSRTYVMQTLLSSVKRK